MTTEGRGLVRALALALPLVAAGWFAVLAGVLRAGAAVPAVMVLFPPADLLENLPGVAVTGASALSVTLTDGRADLPARVRAAGGVILLPAGLAPCVPGG